MPKLRIEGTRKRVNAATGWLRCAIRFGAYSGRSSYAQVHKVNRSDGVQIGRPGLLSKH